VREKLAVDVQLAHATGDQLRELAPEVQDDDRIGLGRDLLRTLRRRRVKRLLEVRLDLGVVRGQDPMAGVRRLAMDGPPPRRRR